MFFQNQFLQNAVNLLKVNYKSFRFALKMLFHFLAITFQLSGFWGEARVPKSVSSFLLWILFFSLILRLASENIFLPKLTFSVRKHLLTQTYIQRLNRTSKSVMFFQNMFCVQRLNRISKSFRLFQILIYISSENLSKINFKYFDFSLKFFFSSGP